jgi:hypothetical protein
VFDEGVLLRIFGPKREEAAREWRRLHNEEVRNVYASPNIIKAIKPKRIRWAGQIPCMGYI